LASDEGFGIEDDVARSANRILLCSGGFDSTVMTIQKIWEWSNYRKLPTVAYLDTTIGVPMNRLYIESICDMYRVPLATIRTQEPIERTTGEFGLYKPINHDGVFQKQKGRQIAHLARRYDTPHFYWASREDESEKRKKTMRRMYGPDSTVRRDDELSRDVRNPNDVYHHAPYRFLSAEDVLHRAKMLKIPPNPMWFMETPSDCGCGATAKAWEKEELWQEGLEQYAQRIENLEEIAEDAGHENSNWGYLPGWVEREMEATASQQTLDGKEVGSSEHLATMSCGAGGGCQKSSLPVSSVEEYAEVVFGSSDRLTNTDESGEAPDEDMVVQTEVN